MPSHPLLLPQLLPLLEVLLQVLLGLNQKLQLPREVQWL